MKAAAPVIPAIDLSVIAEPVRSQVQRLLDLLNVLIAENRGLRGRIDELVRRYFGNKKNEGLSAQQLELALQGLTGDLIASATQPAPADVPKSNPKDKAKKPVRQRVPENLPIRNTQVLIPDEVQKNPDLWREIDRDVTDILDYEPGKFLRDQIIRPRYVPKQPADLDQDTIVAAPLPNRLIEKGLPGPGLLAFVYLERFLNHQPYYRLQQTFLQRHQIHLSRQTLSDWAEQGAQWLIPVVKLMRERLLRLKYIQVDETPIDYLDRDERGKSHKGYLWAYSDPKGDVIFDWNVSRSREGPEKFLGEFEGFLQSDGYSAYVSLAESNPKLKMSHCVAHWRRKFIEAKDEDRRALWFLVQFRNLYAVEARLRSIRAETKLRGVVRGAESKPIWNRIWKAIDRLKSKLLPGTRLMEAFNYGANQKDGLCKFLDHGELEIDTNLVENAIRPTALGKKNFLFIGHPEAGWKSAVFYTILGSCMRRRINPEQYLRDVLIKLPDMKQSELEKYLPEEWIKRHPEARVAKIK